MRTSDMVSAESAHVTGPITNSLGKRLALVDAPDMTIQLVQRQVHLQSHPNLPPSPISLLNSPLTLGYCPWRYVPPLCVQQLRVYCFLCAPQLPQAPMWSNEEELVPPPTLNLTDHQVATLQETLQDHNLVLTVEVSPDGPVHDTFNKRIEEFCLANQFKLKASSNAKSTLTTTSVANYRWTFYVPLRRSVNHTRNFGAKLLTSDTFTAANLRRSPFGNNVANHLSSRVFAFIGEWRL